VRVAALERFAEPSRRVDRDKVAAPHEELIIWELPGLDNRARTIPRYLRAGLSAWLRGGIPLSRRLGLLRACLGTRGARTGTFLRAAEFERLARAGRVDRLVCFSTKDLALAGALGEAVGVPCEELIARGTQYFGEFAFELLAVIPYAYWLHTQGRLEFTVSTPDTRCLYYFSKRHEERPIPRRYVPITEYPLGRPGQFKYDRTAFPRTLDRDRWLPPPYREVYAGERLSFEREPCVVVNKTSDEISLRGGSRAAVNSLDHELLLAVLDLLRDRYQVVYSRPRADDIVNDHQDVRETGDIEAVKRAYPDVLTIQELHEDHRDLTFNELQMRLYAACDRFVSVQGGGAYLASYFGGTNVVYARSGWEVSCRAFENWFHLFSGARVVAAATPAELLETIRRELL